MRQVRIDWGGLIIEGAYHGVFAYNDCLVVMIEDRDGILQRVDITDSHPLIRFKNRPNIAEFIYRLWCSAGEKCPGITRID